MTRWAAAAGLAALCACGGDFDPGSRVTSLRVLAVVADNPYAKPGETIHATLYDYDPTDPTGTSPQYTTTYAWAACVNPQSSTVIGCLATLFQQASAAGGNPLSNGTLAVETNNVGFTYTVPSHALDGLTGQARANALVGLVSVVCPGTLSFDANVDPNSGQLPIQCADATTGRVLDLTEFQIGIKRVFVRETDRNNNPVIDHLTWDGQPWRDGDIKQVQHCSDNGNRFDRCDNSLAHYLSAVVTPDSFESGTDELGNAFTEQVIVEYYATEGTFLDDVREANDPETQWVARSQSAGLLVNVWFVVHDNRGGAAIAQRQVQVAP
ncbi:MAG: hypothetical protein ACHREM_23895 [Polyangiales bacterium]